jgi:hypothetical protein
MIGAQPRPRSETAHGENQQMESGFEMKGSARQGNDGGSYAPGDPDDGNGCNGRAPDKCELDGRAPDSESTVHEATS